MISKELNIGDRLPNFLHYYEDLGTLETSRLKDYWFTIISNTNCKRVKYTSLEGDKIIISPKKGYYIFKYNPIENIVFVFEQEDKTVRVVEKLQLKPVYYGTGEFHIYKTLKGISVEKKLLNTIKFLLFKVYFNKIGQAPRYCIPQSGSNYSHPIIIQNKLIYNVETETQINKFEGDYLYNICLKSELDLLDICKDRNLPNLMTLVNILKDAKGAYPSLLENIKLFKKSECYISRAGVDIPGNGLINIANLKEFLFYALFTYREIHLILE